MPSRPKFWAVVREALHGSRQDYTEGPISRAILLLAVPMVMEMTLESVFAVVDVYFVGRLGAEAVATVGLTESMLALLYAAALGLGVGATALVARRIGEHDAGGASHTAGQAVMLGLFVALVLGTTGAVLAPRLLAAMGAGPSVVATGTGYARVMLGGSGSILMLFLLNAIFRGAGDAAIAMRVLWLANAINIVLDPCLIFGLGPFPHLGVAGAAVATTTGRTVGALYALSRARSGRVAGYRAAPRPRGRCARDGPAAPPLGRGALRRSSAARAGSASYASPRRSAARCSPATRSGSASWCSPCCHHGA